TIYSFTMNSEQMSYTDAQVKTVLVYGLGGNDTGVVDLSDSFTITGQNSPQQLPFTAVLNTGGGYVLNNIGDVFLQFYQFTNSAAYLPNNVSGFLYTPPSSNSRLVTAGHYSYVTGNGEFHLINGGSALYGFSTNASDQVYHYDGPGQK